MKVYIAQIVRNEIKSELSSLSLYGNISVILEFIFFIGSSLKPRKLHI